MGEGVLATPAISDRLIIFRTLHHVIAVGGNPQAAAR
jgi:hypothetical protein